MIKVMSIFGTRPEAIKMAPLVKELERNKAFGDTSSESRRMEQKVERMGRVERNEFERHVEEKYETEREQIDRKQSDLKESFAIYTSQLYDEFRLAVDVSMNETLAEEGIKIDILKLELYNVQRLLDMERSG